MKEIIIDGVNVAGCNKLSEYENGCDSPDTGSLYCDNNPNCLYKQLKRKEQENAILKAEKEKYYQQTIDDEIQINELLQTLQEVKAIVSGNYEWLDPQALQEIRSIITKAEVGE